MKTTKKNGTKSSKKADVKKDITTQPTVQPTPSEIVKTQDKVTKTDAVLTYVTTFPSVTLKDSKEIIKLIKSEHKEVKDRIEERKINITDIVKITKYGHKQLLNGKEKSNSMKFHMTLKNDKTIIMNFRNYKI